MKNWKEGRKMINVVCENCKINFLKVKSEYDRNEKNKNKHFCCIKCCIAFNKKYDENVKNKCKFCGKEIPYEKRRNQFCSKNCSASYNNKGRVGEKRKFSVEGINNIKKSNIKKHGVSEYEYYKNPNQCKECGKILKYKKRNQIFCEMGCKRIFDKKKMTKLNIYKSQCSFKFNLNHFKDEFDFELIKKFGWYSAKNRGNNLNGVSRDHMYSIHDGFKNNVDPNIISHPANCKLMVHSDNSKKRTNSSISLDELKKRIEWWNLKYNKI